MGLKYLRASFFESSYLNAEHFGNGGQTEPVTPAVRPRHFINPPVGAGGSGNPEQWDVLFADEVTRKEFTFAPDPEPTFSFSEKLERPPGRMVMVAGEKPVGEIGVGTIAVLCAVSFGVGLWLAKKR